MFHNNQPRIYDTYNQPREKVIIIRQTQPSIEFSDPEPVHYPESNAAYNLLGGPRLGTIGWHPRLWDNGRQYDNGKLVNQAHHFVYFFIRGLESNGIMVKSELSKMGATVIDPFNPGDRDLGYLAIELGQQVNSGSISWNRLPNIVYEAIKLGSINISTKTDHNRTKHWKPNYYQKKIL